MTSKPHPSELPIERLLAECTITRTRRSGPGGQHRNKVETAVVIEHKPTSVRAEASEERSQLRNQAAAVARLRVTLAIVVRTERTQRSDLWKSRCRGGRMQINDQHEDFAKLLAESLDVFVANDLDHKATAAALECSVSQLVKLWRKSGAAFQWINDTRESAGLHRLS